jgi:hypothetical protein
MISCVEKEGQVHMLTFLVTFAVVFLLLLSAVIVHIMLHLYYPDKRRVTRPQLDDYLFG